MTDTMDTLVKVHVNVPAQIMDPLDNLAAKQYTKRSEVVRQALLHYVRTLPDDVKADIGFIDED